LLFSAAKLKLKETFVLPRCIKAALFLILGVRVIVGQENVGIPRDGYPNWYERSVFVFTNACRMNPTQFRDSLIGSYNILLPENYPPVDPLLIHHDLNRSARFHSKDMAEHSTLQHKSSDGTPTGDRIRSFYDESFSIAENICVGGLSPLGAVRFWILESFSEPYPDGQNDGHRKNIMNGTYSDIGVGMAEDGNDRYYTQDFGGASRAATHPLAAGGSHNAINTGDSVDFFVNYYSSSGAAPQTVLLNVDGSSYEMKPYLGSPGRGLYLARVPKSDDCREYFFETVDAAGIHWLYPEDGVFHTFGEGQCADNFGISTRNRSAKTPLADSNGNISFRLVGKRLVFPGGSDRSVTIYGVRGRMIDRVTPGTNYRDLRSGVYVLESMGIRYSVVVSGN